jgi:hypothetical protein
VVASLNQRKSAGAYSSAARGESAEAGFCRTFGVSGPMTNIVCLFVGHHAECVGDRCERSSARSAIRCHLYGWNDGEFQAKLERLVLA